MNFKRILFFSLTVTQWATFTFVVILIVMIASPQLPIKNYFQSYIVISGSIEPTISAGSLAIVEPVTLPQIAVGDVIAFTQPDHLDVIVLHRVTAIEDNGLALKTKGDNNNAADTWIVTGANIKGRFTHAIPYVGATSAMLHTQPGFVLLVGLPALYFIFLFIKLIKKGIDEEVEKKVKKKLQTTSVEKMLIIFFIPATMLSLSHSASALFTSEATVSEISVSAAQVLPSTSPIVNPSPTPSVMPSPSLFPSPSPAASPGTQIDSDLSRFCSVVQLNETYTTVDIHIETNTGENSGGSINTGNVENVVRVETQGGLNTLSAICPPVPVESSP